MNKEIRVLHIVHSFDISGRSRIIYELCSTLNKNSVYSLVVSLTDNCRFPISQNGIKLVSLGKIEGVDLNVIYKLRQIVKKERVSLIHSHGKGALVYGVIVKRLARVEKLVHTVHRSDGDIFTRNSAFKKMIRSHVDRLVGVSDSARFRFSHGHDFPIYKTETIYAGINLSNYGRREPFKVMLPKAKPLIGTVANFSNDKDFETLILAFKGILKIYPEAHMIIVGDGPKKNEVKKFARDAGLFSAIDFLGFRNDVEVILPNFDIFVLSTRIEGLGVSMLEAMASKVPVVASAVSGVREVIEEGRSGKLFTYGNIRELKEAILSVYKNKKLCEIFVKTAYKRVRKDFSLEKMCESYERVYNEI